MRRAVGVLVLVGCGAPVDDVPEPERWATLATAERLADEGAVRWPAATQVFNWIPAVWGYGVLGVHEASDAPRHLAYGTAWMEASLPRFGGEDPLRFTASDEMAAAGVASIVAHRAGLDLAPILAEADAYLDTRAPRVANGAIAHWGDSPFFDEDQVWVDSLFMVGMYWLAEHDRTGEAGRLDAVAEQYARFSELCRDPDDDLYRHAWDDSDGVNIPADALYWARGNAWVLVVGAELLARVERDGPIWEAVQPAFAAHAEAVAATQAPDGLWRTVLNDPFPGDGRNYTETAGSALVLLALARGVEVGALEGEAWTGVIDGAVEGLLGRVRDDGESLLLEGTSLGTNPGDYDNYVDTPVLDGFALGVGAAAWALAVVDGT